MKKLLLVIILLLTMFMSQNVYAEDVIAYEIGDNQFIIDKFAIRVYQLNVVDGLMDDDSLVSYQSNEYSREIEIPGVTVNPEAYRATISNIDMNFVKLNTNITEDTLKGLLTTEINSATDTNQYLAELVVHYRLYETPEKYTKFYTLNAYKDYIKATSDLVSIPEGPHFIDQYVEIQKTDTIVQPVNLISITADEFNYYKTAESTTPILSLYNYLQLAESEAEFEHPKYEIIFTNISDVQYFANQIREMYESPEEPEEPAQPAQPEQPEQPTVPENPHTSVNIPDTALDKSHIVIIAGIVMIIAGLGATYIVFRKTN